MSNIILTAQAELTGKTVIADQTQEIIRLVEQGEIDPLAVKITFKAIESVIKTASGTIDKYARDQAETFGTKSFVFKGAKIELAETGTKYDYLNCGDPVYSEMLLEQALLEEKIKAREQFLKNLPEPIEIVDEKTGEMCKVCKPVKSSTSSLKISFV